MHLIDPSEPRAKEFDGKPPQMPAKVSIVRASFKPAPTGGFPITLRITSFIRMTIEFLSKLQGNHTTNLQEN